MSTTSKSPNPKIGNADLFEQLKDIDYNALTGETFDNYRNIVLGKLTDPKKKIESDKNPRINGLPANDLYDFEGYRAIAVKEELYEGMKDTPIIVTGIKLKDKVPELITRITVGHANLMNAQVSNFDARVPGIYYLIKKVNPSAVADVTTSETGDNKNANKNKAK